ncbi:tetratricopeptide repeat protein [Amycolatopsis sp. CA-230715]|uniref:tetratricopeptide repeat protein n=1 Tax=Amycolatopsis sp. CA-230715 TaxID=2745196 RepID=UPI001C01A3AD|nr:tetratricopeptide repeat protein [Amycolatopsis sp. CA-230715]QWF85132.1 Regulatory protein AfsR [Amycolatopsis sp. CA-230715]
MNDEIRNTVTGDVFFSTVIQGRDITVVLPPRIIPAMTGLPPATPSFTGRDSDLAALLDTLTPSETAEGPVPTLVTAAVGGMGGIGKTELALQAARTALDRGWFPGGVLFTDMRGYETDPGLRHGPGHALESFLRAVGVPGEHIPADVQDRSRLLRSVLATYAAKGRRVLLVIDNVSTSGQAVPLLPSDGSCAAIVTSRHVLADLDARLLNLDTLPVDLGADLLDKALLLRDPADSRVHDHPGDAARLAELCAGLPLALRIVAAQLAANPAKPLAAMTTDLGDVASRLDGMTFADRAVHAVFDSSYHQLVGDRARLFRLLSLNPGPDFSSSAAASLAGLAEADARRGLEALAQAHLIEPGTGYDRWRLHDLLRLHSARHGELHAEPDRREQALARLLGYYLTTTGAANAHLDPRVEEPGALGFPDQEHALNWLDVEYANLTAATFTVLADHPAIGRDLPQAMWHFLRRRRYLNDWIALSEAAVDAARSLADRDGEATALNALGSALQEMGRIEEAVTAHTDAARFYRDVGNHHGEGKALINLGAALLRNKLADQAVTALHGAAEMFQQTGDRVHEVMALQNLGTALRAQGRLDEAVTIHTDVVRIYRDLRDRHGEAIAADNLGSSLHEVQRFDEAIDAHRSAARYYHEEGDHYGEAMALNSLGLSLREVQRTEEAITAHQDAARLAREVGDHDGEAMALNNLGNALGGIRRFDEAAAAHGAAIDAYREAGDLNGQSSALQNLGIALRQLGDAEEAVTAHRAAARISHELGGRFREAAALHGLGMALREAGRFDEAVTACQEAAEIFRDLGDDRNEEFALEDLRRARNAQGADGARWWRRRRR